MDIKVAKRQKIKFRIRKKITGTASRPRLSVYRSCKEIYAQIIDDATGVTLASASSRAKDIAASGGTKSDKSKLVGVAIAKAAAAKGITSVVFDRGGNLYHGRVQLLADSAREGGLNF
jgi:large subunit ribosomal protein L18